MDVLVQARVEDFDADTAFDLLEEVEQEVNRYFQRCWRPLGDTELAGRPVASVEHLPMRAGAPGVPAEEFLPTSPSTEDRALFVLNQVQDDRLETIMGSLSPTECQVVWAWSMTQTSWQDAALVCGLPVSEGERVRAKLARRTKQITAISVGPTSPFSR